MKQTLLIFIAVVLPTILVGSPVATKVKKTISNGVSTTAAQASNLLNNVIEKNVAVTAYVGNTALNAATAAGQAAVDAVTNIDVEKAINDTEDAIVNGKVAVIKKAFDAKRKAIKYIGNVTAENKDTIMGLLNSTIDGINFALNATTKGIVITKQGVSNVASTITVENAQSAVNTAQESLTTALNATLTALQDTAQALTEALVNAKLALTAAISNSTSSTSATTKAPASNLAGNVNLTVSGQGNITNSWGILNVFDGIVQSLSGIPDKLTGLLNLGINKNTTIKVGNVTANIDVTATVGGPKAVEPEEVLVVEFLEDEPPLLEVDEEILN